jgi:hypothetical protein
MRPPRRKPEGRDPFGLDGREDETTMINFLFGVLRQTWEILEDASVFLLFGC